MKSLLSTVGRVAGAGSMIYMRNDGSFARRLVDHCSEIRVKLSEVLKISIQGIVKA